MNNDLLFLLFTIILNYILLEKNIKLVYCFSIFYSFDVLM